MDSDETEIRPAYEREAGLLLQLIRELAEYERLAHDVTATEEQIRQTLFGPKRYAEALLAFVGGQPAGFAVFLCSYSTFAARPVLYLEDLFVRPSFRGKGLGRRLLRAAFDAGVEKRCVRMDWSVLDWNEVAIAFYDSLGAKPHREWIKYSLIETPAR